MSNQKLVKSYSLNKLSSNRYDLFWKQIMRWAVSVSSCLSHVFEWMKMNLVNHSHVACFYFSSSLDFKYRLNIWISLPFSLLQCSIVVQNFFLSNWKGALSIRKWNDVCISQFLTFFSFVHSFVRFSPKGTPLSSSSTSFPKISSTSMYVCMYIFICNRTVFDQISLNFFWPLLLVDF